MSQARKTLNDYANLIGVEFNIAFSAASTAVYIFKNRINAWLDMPFILGDVSDDIASPFIQSVIAPYVEPITRENEIIKRVTNPTYNQITKKTTHETNYGHVVTTAHSGETTTTFTDGGEKIRDYIYPAGYRGASDTAYITSEQQRESPANNITQEKPNTTDTATDSGKDSDTVIDFDLSAWIAALTADGKEFNIIKYIDKIIFSLIDPIL